MAVKFRAVRPKAETSAASCFGQNEVSSKLAHLKDITLSGVAAQHLLSHICFRADPSQY